MHFCILDVLTQKLSGEGAAFKLPALASQALASGGNEWWWWCAVVSGGEW